MGCVKDEICNTPALHRWKLKYFPEAPCGHEPECRTKRGLPAKMYPSPSRPKQPPPLPSRGSVAAEPVQTATVCLVPAPAEPEPRVILTPRRDVCEETVAQIRKIHREQQARKERDQNIILTPRVEKMPPPAPPQPKSKLRQKAAPRPQPEEGSRLYPDATGRREEDCEEAGTVRSFF